MAHVCEDCGCRCKYDWLLRNGLCEICRNRCEDCDQLRKENAELRADVERLTICNERQVNMLTDFGLAAHKREAKLKSKLRAISCGDCMAPNLLECECEDERPETD